MCWRIKAHGRKNNPSNIKVSMNRSVMIDMDEWGRDPSVQAMRKVFKGMEKSLEEILGQLNITPYDQRIRGWLEMALAKFETAWIMANQMGISMNEKIAPSVYTHCLARVMSSEGIKIPEGILPEGKDTARLLHEVFK